MSKRNITRDLMAISENPSSQEMKSIEGKKEDDSKSGFFAASRSLLKSVTGEIFAFRDEDSKEEVPQASGQLISYSSAPSQKSLMSASRDFLKGVSRELVSAVVGDSKEKKKLTKKKRTSKMKVFITVDTEFWPDNWELTPPSIFQAMKRDIYGRGQKYDFGLPMQIDILNHYNIKASFFVEALSASVVGKNQLREIVEMLQKGGQEVQLHVHPEWVDKSSSPILPGRSGVNMHQFSEEEQYKMFGLSLENLAACGAPNINAFRAGNYGAGNSTLRALRRHGVRFDTSYNHCYLDSTCAIKYKETVLQPREIDGIVEIPVNFFEDWPGHQRHTQLCACSFEEMSNAMLNAYEQDWYSFVIVSHSFELLNQYRTGPDRSIIQRFKKLCKFLDQNRDKFEVVGFLDLEEKKVPLALHVEPLRSKARHTLQRFGSQATRKIPTGAFSQISYDVLERFSPEDERIPSSRVLKAYSDDDGLEPQS